MAMFDRIVREQDRGCPAGTLPFMAPEQLLHVDGYSPASDLYSLGITLYQLAAGKLPQQVARPIYAMLSSQVCFMPMQLYGWKGASC